MDILRVIKNRLYQMILNLWKKGAFYVFTGSFLTKFVVFFGSMFIVRVLTKNEYGQLTYMENLYGWIYIIAGLGLTNAILRYVVLAQDIQEKYNIFQYSIRESLKYNLVILLCFLGLNQIYPHPSSFENLQLLMSVMLIMMPFQYLLDSDLALERAMFNNKRYALLAFFSSVALIWTKFLGATIQGIFGVVCFGLASNLIFGVGFYVLARRKYFAGFKYSPPEKGLKKEMRIYSLQYMITNGIWTIFMLSDVFLLGKLCDDPTILAEYKVAYVWPGNLSIVCSAIGIFVGPYFVKNENNLSWVRTNYKKVLIGTLGLVFFVAGLMFIFAKPLILIYAGKSYISVAPLLQLLTISAFINNGLRYTTANILAAMGQIKYNMIVSIIGIILQLSINCLMIPRFGAYGVAYTSMGVYLFMAVVLFFVFRKKYFVK